MLHFILLVVAIILFFVAAILAFRWFGTSSADDALGWMALGLIAFVAAHIPFAERTRRVP